MILPTLDIGSAFLIIAIIINVFLAFISLARVEKKNISSYFFILFLFSLGAWATSLLFYGYTHIFSISLTLSKIAYISAGFSALTFLNFTITFSIFSKKIRKSVLLFSFFYLVLLFSTISTNKIIAGFKVFSTPTESILLFGPYYFMYVIFLLISFLGGLLFLFLTYRHEKELIKIKQLEYIFTGVIITLVLAFTTNLILPTLGNFNLYWSGPIFTIIMAIFITIAIAKHNLFNLKIITTELLVAVSWVSITARILLSRDEQDQIFNFIFLIITIILGIFLIRSVRREVQQRELLAEANKQLQRLNLEKSEFLSLATHQLKSPLTVIRGYTSMLMEGSYGKMPDKAQETLSRVYDSVANLVIIIDDFLNVSRIDQGRMSYDFGIIDVKKLVNDIVEEMKHIAKSKNVELAGEVKAEGDFHITADYGKIRQILSNIIDNAIKYTKEGTVNILAEEDLKNKKIRISVFDNGIGMTKETIAKLFKRFSRAKDVGKVEIGGSGLGLYIAKEMVEAHGGKIWAESQGDGRGSVFRVELPFLPPNITPLRKRQENNVGDSIS